MGEALYRTFDNPYNEKNNQNTKLEYVPDTFKAFVNAIIPRSKELAELYGRIQYYGALDLYTDEYLVMSLNSFILPLAIPTAEMLNIAAAQLVYMYKDYRISDYSRASAWQIFSELSPIVQLQVVNLLLQPIDYLSELPNPFQNDQGNIFFSIMLLNRLTMMGYYSEWSGYGTTRLEPPNQRILEHYPISWEQVGYPGPSLGYRISSVYTINE